MLRLVFLFVAVVFGVSFAEDAVPSVPANLGSIPAEWLPVIVLVVNAALGLLQKVAYKVPGIFGKILQAITDVLSANTKH